MTKREVVNLSLCGHTGFRALACEEEEEAAEEEVDDKAQGTGDGGSGEETRNKGRLIRSLLEILEKVAFFSETTR